MYVPTSSTEEARVISLEKKTNEDDAMAFLDILAFTAIVSTIGMFLTGLSICNTIKRIGSTRGVSPVPFLLCCVSCLFWLRYGMLKNDRTVIIINVIGLSLELAYTVYYYVYTSDKDLLHQMIMASAAVSVGMLFYIGVMPLSHETAISHLGMMCLILNVLNFGAPLSSVKHVMDTKTTNALPFPLIVANLVVAAQWFLYGYLVDDIYMKIPNLIGIALSLLQLSLFAIYPVRSHG